MVDFPSLQTHTHTYSRLSHIGEYSAIRCERCLSQNMYSNSKHKFQFNEKPIAEFGCEACKAIRLSARRKMENISAGGRKEGNHKNSFSIFHENCALHLQNNSFMQFSLNPCEMVNILRCYTISSLTTRRFERVDNRRCEL